MSRMPQSFSEYSRLKPHDWPYEDRPISHILEDVEERVRTICRVMQVFRFQGTSTEDTERDWEDRGRALVLLYEYIDQQMDTLSELCKALDAAGWITLNALRDTFDGRNS